ncbi:MAG: hypothetical protein KC478_15385 [Bacteriovoracaceae bacterium]|nr:hypothetical protein [Bacteriovoracaceae bacterium]
MMKLNRYAFMALILSIFMTDVSTGEVLPIAHRGASAYAPENTLSSITKSIELGAKYVEIDVHMTKDGEVVAIHDTTIDRTSNGKGKVREYTLVELREFDFGLWFHADFKGEIIPTISDVLRAIGDEVVLIIEFKYGGSKYPRIEEKVVEDVLSLERKNQVILKSFDSKILTKFKNLAPEIESLYCTFGGNSFFTVDNSLRLRGILKESSFSYLQVHKYFLGKSLVEKAHNKGIKVIVWDVHDKPTMQKFKAMGVDFIETDNPDYVIEL